MQPASNGTAEPSCRASELAPAHLAQILRELPTRLVITPQGSTSLVCARVTPAANDEVARGIDRVVRLFATALPAAAAWSSGLPRSAGMGRRFREPLLP